MWVGHYIAAEGYTKVSLFVLNRTLSERGVTSNAFQGLADGKLLSPSLYGLVGPDLVDQYVPFSRKKKN